MSREFLYSESSIPDGRTTMSVSQPNKTPWSEDSVRGRPSEKLMGRQGLSKTVRNQGFQNDQNLVWTIIRCLVRGLKIRRYRYRGNTCRNNLRPEIPTL